MIKVGIKCHRCDAFVSQGLHYTTAVPYWGWSLWKAALSAGWARRTEDQTPFCANCKSELEEPSTVVLPVNPLPMLGYIECDSCSSRFKTNDIHVGEHFARELRKEARAEGWRLISVDKNQSYQDYCPSCEPDELGKQRTALLELVWSQATVRVAEELKISDNAVAKRCKRLGIPKPPRGFWSKYDAGHIGECIAIIPPIVYDLLGNAFVDEIYSLDRNN